MPERNGIVIVASVPAAWRAEKSRTVAKLASTGVETPLIASTQSGVAADGMVWQADIRAYASASEAAQSAPDLHGFWVTVTVRWKEGPRRPEQSLQLQTIKLRRGP